MPNPFPRHISNEKDLMLYEDFLNNEKQNTNVSMCKLEPKAEIINPPKSNKPIPYTAANQMFFTGYLKNHIGKLVKVESLLNSCLVPKVGILFEVGANYIVLKLKQNACSMIIEASTIKYITIIHNNDYSSISGY